MQSAVPKGEGTMVAVLGSEISLIEKLIKNNICFEIANDNSNGQIVVSGKTKDIENFVLDLKTGNKKYYFASKRPISL